MYIRKECALSWFSATCIHHAFGHHRCRERARDRGLKGALDMPLEIIEGRHEVGLCVKSVGRAGLKLEEKTVMMQDPVGC